MSRSPTRAGDPPTARQAEVLAVIRARLAATGLPPSVREIGDALGIRSPNGVVCHLDALREKGLIGRARNRARAITLPGGGGDVSLPLLGRVAAGPLLEAAPQADRLDLRALFGADGNFAYRVAGDGLRPANISAGDSLILRPAGPADGGRTVAAETAGDAVGLYDYLTGRAGVRLSPRHGAAPAERLLGVLVGVIRKT